MRNLFLSIILAFITVAISAQEFGISAEIRPRYEIRHGYSTLIEPDQDASNFISQRTKLNVNFASSKIKLGVSIQNVSVWGDASTMNTDEKTTAIYVAWAEAIFSEKFSVQFGRQELVYDDQRIFGNVGWAQQGRSHDALVAHWDMSEKSKLDVGLALNADGQANTETLYSNVAGYKACLLYTSPSPRDRG